MKPCAIYFYPPVLIPDSSFSNCGFHYCRQFLRVSQFNPFCGFQTNGLVWLGCHVVHKWAKMSPVDAVRKSDVPKNPWGCWRFPIWLIYSSDGLKPPINQDLGDFLNVSSPNPFLLRLFQRTTSLLNYTMLTSAATSRKLCRLWRRYLSAQRRSVISFRYSSLLGNDNFLLFQADLLDLYLSQMCFNIKAQWLSPSQTDWFGIHWYSNLVERIYISLDLRPSYVEKEMLKHSKEMDQKH